MVITAIPATLAMMTIMKLMPMVRVNSILMTKVTEVAIPAPEHTTSLVEIKPGYRPVQPKLGELLGVTGKDRSATPRAFQLES